MLITVKSYHNVEHLAFRIELLSNDGNFIGTSFSEDMGSMIKGQTETFSLCMPTNNIIPGQYSATVVLFQKTSYQSSNDLDYVVRAFAFEIADMENKMPIVWKREKWGHVILENMLLLQKRNAEE